MLQPRHRQAAAAALSSQHFQIVFVAVVGNDQRLRREQIEKQRQRLRSRRRSEKVAVTNAVNARCLGGDVNTRIDAAAVRRDGVTVEDNDGLFNDPGLLRRLGGGFEIEGGEVVGKSGSDGHAARCGSDSFRASAL